MYLDKNIDFRSIIILYLLDKEYINRNLIYLLLTI